MLALTFQIGSERLALDVRQIVEVIPSVPLQSIAGSPPWLSGTCLFRGRVVPVVDLHQLVGVGVCPRQLSTRIILVRIAMQEEERVMGLLASHVDDIRELPDAKASTRPTIDAERPDLGDLFVADGQIYHFVVVEHLLPEPHRRSAWAMTRELVAWT